MTLRLARLLAPGPQTVEHAPEQIVGDAVVVAVQQAQQLPSYSGRVAARQRLTTPWAT